jgi:arylsulfatase A-like enzyme
VDQQLGRVLDHLDRTGQAGHTLVVVTSDHGEEFAEHGGYEHLRTLYDEVLRIPLVVRAPRVAPRTSAAQVSLLDIAPTVLAAVGLPREASHEGQNLLGTIEPRDAYGETEFGSPPGAPRARKLFLRQGQAGPKLVLTLDRRTDALLVEEWFDLRRDPRELASARPPEPSAAAWRARLLERWRAARATGSEEKPVTLGADEQERLRALGYVGR